MIGSLDTNTITTYHLFLEPELSVFALEHGEEWFESFDHDQIFDLSLTRFFPAAGTEPADKDDEDHDEDVEDEGRSGRDLAEEVLEVVLG